MTNRRIPALAYRQGDRTLFLFAAPPCVLGEVLTLSRLRREDGHLAGYQRPEVTAHIAEIATYVRQPHALLPNALVVAFDCRVTFEGDADGAGVLVVPLTDEPAERSGWVVDGQQRLAALLDAGRNDFSVACVAFIATGMEEQRAQFVLVNNTRPLPRSLLYEMLPYTDAVLPAGLEAKRLPAQILEALNTDVGGPFYRRVQTATHPTGDLRDNSVLRMLQNSLSDGVLFRFRGARSGAAQADVDEMQRVLTVYWAAVARTFPEAWRLPPRQSRLTHGAGVIAMGYLMDTLADAGARGVLTPRACARALKRVAAHCAWTSGTWPFDDGARRWNEIQNTSQDIRRLTRHLLRTFAATGRAL